VQCWPCALLKTAAQAHARAAGRTLEVCLRRKQSPRDTFL
jgi:hypothetical protein